MESGILKIGQLNDDWKYDSYAEKWKLQGKF